MLLQSSHDWSLGILQHFLDDQLFSIASAEHLPWFADIANYLACGVKLGHLNPHKKKKFFHELKFYFWDDPLLFKECADSMIRRCVPEEEALYAMRHCHNMQCDGYAADSKTVAKILESGFYWLTLHKDT